MASYVLLLLLLLCLLTVGSSSHQNRWTSSNHPQVHTAYSPRRSETIRAESYPRDNRQKRQDLTKQSDSYSRRQHLYSMSLVQETEPVSMGTLKPTDVNFINELARINPVSAILEYIERIQALKACNQSISLSRFNYDFPSSSYERFTAQTRAATRTANVLNNLFRTHDAEPTLYNDAFYYSLARAIVENDPLIYGSAIAFERGKYGKRSNGFCPYVYRRKHGGIGGKFTVLDMAEVPNTGYLESESAGYEWFWKQREKNYSDLLYSKREMCQQLKVSDDPRKVANHTVVVSTEAHGQWTSPYYDCDGGKSWLITYSVPFFGCDDRNNLQFK